MKWYKSYKRDLEKRLLLPMWRSLRQPPLPVASTKREEEKQGMPVSRGRHRRGADVDKGAKLSDLEDLSF